MTPLHIFSVSKRSQHAYSVKYNRDGCILIKSSLRHDGMISQLSQQVIKRKLSIDIRRQNEKLKSEDDRDDGNTYE